MKNKNVAEQLVLEFFERVWHEPHELEAINDLMAEDYIINTAGKEIRGRDEFKQWVSKFQQQLANAKTESQMVFANDQGDKVVSRWICSGHNNGLFGLKADGRAISFSGIAIWTVKDNLLKHCWVERSAHELYQSLNTGNTKNDFV